MQLYSFTFPVDVFFGGHCVFDSAPAWAPALLLQFRVQTVVTLLHTKGLPVYSYNGAFLVAQIPPKTWHPASAMLLPQYGHYGSAAVDGNLRMNNDVTEGGRRRGGPLSKALALHEFSSRLHRVWGFLYCWHDNLSANGTARPIVSLIVCSRPLRTAASLCNLGSNFLTDCMLNNAAWSPQKG